MRSKADQYSHSRKDNRTSLWRTDAFGGLEMIRARYEDFSFSPHAHDEFMLAATESGLGQPHIQGKTHRIHPDDIILLNPGQVHGGGTGPDTFWHYRGFYPSAKLMELVAQDFGQRVRGIPFFSKNVVTDPYMTALLRNVHLVLETSRSALQSESLLLSLLARLIERHAADRPGWHPLGSENKSVQRAKAYLQALPARNVTLEELAGEANLSPYYFCRVFHKETGLSPHAYQLLVRVRFAKDLLLHGHPISQAAVAAGFFDQAHFTRHFKRVYGVSPRRFLPIFFPNAD